MTKECLLSEEVQEEIGRGLGFIKDTSAAREVRVHNHGWVQFRDWLRFERCKWAVADFFWPVKLTIVI